MNIVESLKGIIGHTSRTQSPTEKKLFVEQLIHNDSADDYDDE